MGFDAGAIMEEGLDELLSLGRMANFRMPLHAVQSPGHILHGRNRCTLRVREHLETLRRLFHRNTVAHPCALLRRGILEDTLGMVDRCRGLAVFAKSRSVDDPAELMSHDLESVADAQHGNARGEYLGVDARRTRLEDRGRSSRKDDGLRILGEDLIHRHRMRHQFRVDVGLPHPTRNQLRVLRTEIDYKNGTLCHMFFSLP